MLAPACGYTPVPMKRDLRPLFDPRSLAILGASANPAKWGNWLAQNALRGEHRRSVFLVNRAGGELLGHPAYPSVRDLPQAVELVVIVVGAGAFEHAVDDALGAGARAIVAITAGLGESGAEGREIERRVVERVRAAGALLVGPNCLGVADTATELDLAFRSFDAGPIGLISQSGNLSLELALLASDAGLGFSRFVSVGNQADLEVNELVEMFATHEATRVIAIYVEDFRDGRAFARSALLAHEAGKLVVLLTVGSSRAGAQAARSHTGALVSASVAVDAACRAAGILRVRTPRELVELAAGLQVAHAPHGRRVGIVGDGGGHVALAADLVTAYRLELPVLSRELADRIGTTLPPAAATQNPVDLAGGGEQDFMNYARVAGSLAASGEVDSVLLTGYFGGYSEDSPELARVEDDVARAMAAAMSAAERPLIVQTMYPSSAASKTLRSLHVPVFGDIQSAVAVLARLVERSAHAPSGIPALPRRAPVSSVVEDYFAARGVMADASIPMVESRPVATRAQALHAARELGFPVVLKALGASHKSDAGGVRLGIESEGELEAAFADMASRLHPVTFSVERMAVESGAVELLLGVRRDHSFGPVLVIGLGGVQAELFEDVVVALAPVTEDVAAELIRSLRAARLLLGVRGGAPLDVPAAARAAVALSELAAQHPDIAEIEINPLLVRVHGVLGLDARVVTS